MVISRVRGALCAVALCFITLQSHAALIGVLPVTSGGTDWQAYYDTDAKLTWLANSYPILPDPPVDLTATNTLAAGININGVTGWRLPTSLNSDGTGPCSQYNCTDSEMGNLFYNVLGGVAGTSIVTTHNSNYDLFSNVRTSRAYWSSTESQTINAWAFNFADGRQFTGNQGNRAYLWGVQSGNVGGAVVPVPAAAWLFGSGLIGLIGIARKREAT